MDRLVTSVRRASLAAGLVVAAAMAPPARALPAPELSLTAGGTWAVKGDLDEGGMALSGAALWPVEGPGPLDDGLRFGVHLFADDLGASIGRLRDPHDGTDLGTAELLHRDAFGGAWRADAWFGGAPWGWRPYASGTWGFTWIQDDHRGAPDESVGSTGFSLALGAVHPVAGATALGLGIRYHRLFNDEVGRYASFAAEWRWGAGVRR